jgi:hypothetical protein
MAGQKRKSHGFGGREPDGVVPNCHYSIVNSHLSLGKVGLDYLLDRCAKSRLLPSRIGNWGSPTRICARVLVDLIQGNAVPRPWPTEIKTQRLSRKPMHLKGLETAASHFHGQ